MRLRPSGLLHHFVPAGRRLHGDFEEPRSEGARQASSLRVQNGWYTFVFLLIELAFFIPSLEAKELKKADVMLSLPALLAEAKANNPEIRAARKEWESEVAKVGAVNTWQDPEAGTEWLGANETKYFVEQTIPFPSKLTLRGKAQAHAARRWYGVYLATEQEILKKTKLTYYDYYRVTRGKEVLTESVNLLKRLSRVAQSKYAVGKAKQSEVLRAQVELARIEYEKVQLEREAKVKRTELNALLNRLPRSPLGRPTKLPLEQIPMNVSVLEELALANRAELHVARHHVDHMEAELAAMRADYFPDATLQVGRRIFTNGMDPDNIYMVKINFPFVWSSRQGSLVKATEEMKGHAEAELSAMETETRSKVETLHLQAETAWYLVDLYQKSALPLARSNLQATLAGYETGQVDFWNVVDAERNWLEFERELVRSVAAYWMQIAELERVVGQELATLSNEEERSHAEK